MIAFALIAERIDYQGCDTLMFTSKQAVISAEAIDPGWKAYPALAVGPATARQIRELGGEVLHQPSDFYGRELAEDLRRLFSERRVLYLRPRKVSFDSRGYLASAGIELKEQVLYETSCRRYRPEDAPPPGSVIVFTSPSTIHCFLENFPWDPNYTAVVIGRATLEHLPKGAETVIAREATIPACIEAAKQVAARGSGE
ncbi:uroporphyrinogen-III synthase [Nitratifractor sp.]